MTKDDLIRMADLAGFDVDEDEVYAPAAGRYGLDPRLEHFAKLVAGYALRYECPKPKKHPWVSLTDEEIDYIWGVTQPDYENFFEFPRAIEAKLKEKNT